MALTISEQDGALLGSCAESLASYACARAAEGCGPTSLRVSGTARYWKRRTRAPRPDGKQRFSVRSVRGRQPTPKRMQRLGQSYNLNMICVRLVSIKTVAKQATQKS